MRVLVLEPGYCPYIATFHNFDDAAKQVISGTYEVSFPFENNVIVLVSSQKQSGLKHNRCINENQIVNGRAMVCRWDGQRVRGLTKEQADRYYRRYLYPEKVENSSTTQLIVPCMTPRIKPKDERLGKKTNWLER